MRVIESWKDKLSDKDDYEQSINDLCFRPDGTQLIVASGNRLLVYDPQDGSIIQTLKGHKETIYCVRYSKDAKRFASGGSDKTVIIWTSELEGILKYTHNDCIQCLAFNPITHVLLSCACTDFGFWSNDQRSVNKTKVTSRITCCSWTNDGQFMAIGFFNGQVQIRDKNGVEKFKLERADTNLPVWSLEWSPSTTSITDENGSANLLAIADWNQRLSFYYLNGKQAYKERKLGYDCTQLNWFNKGEYLVICGSNKQCSLYTKEGIKLGLIGENAKSWIMCARQRPNSNSIVLGSQDGTLVMCQLVFGTVHGLYKERYAYRDNMTDVIIQHLLTQIKVRIKCRDLVKKLAVYRNRLAVQLTDKIVIYEIESQDQKDMHYKVKEKIMKKIECNLFVITSSNLVLCLEKRLQCLNLHGEKVREWLMESPVRYIKVIGGPVAKEGILVGLKSGHVFLIYVDNPFPILLIKQQNSIRCLDVSSLRQKLAVIDDNQTLFVYNIKTQELIFQEPKANSISWNTCYEDMLAYSSNDSTLSICVNTFQPIRQRLQGFVVGFHSSNIFCLNVYSIQSLEISHAESMKLYLEKKMFKEAYDVACLGVTYKDWQLLGLVALAEGRELEISRKAFQRIRDYKYLNLLVQQGKNTSKIDVLIGYTYAYQSKYNDAAKQFKKAKEENLAMQMFSDLRMFDQAKEYINNSQDPSKNQDLLLRQAEWATTNSEPRVAAELYIGAKQYSKAIELAGKHLWADMLLEIVRKLDKADKDLLEKCAQHFKQMKQFNFAAECYEKMGSFRLLIDLRIQSHQWEEVFALTKRYVEYEKEARFRYAQFLAENDLFEDAQKQFNLAGFKQEAIKVLEELTINALLENRFNDASYYYWVLSIEFLNESSSSFTQTKFNKYQKLADIYYAYQHIHSYVTNPFTDLLPETLFHMSKYLLHEIAKLEQVPIGLSKFKILYTSAKMAKELQAFKYSRSVLEKLDELIVSQKYLSEIEQLTMQIKCKPFKDEDELLPLCFRCSHHNPLLNPKGNNCTNCGQAYIFSFGQFEILPLVEFTLADDISDEEALDLIDQVPVSDKSQVAQPMIKQSVNRLVIGEVPSYEHTKKEVDLFVQLMNKYNTNTNEYRPIIVNREILKQIDPTHVIVCKWPKPLKWRFFKSILTDEPIVKCDFCNRFFQSDDYEMAFLQKGHCSFCRRSKEKVPNEKQDN